MCFGPGTCITHNLIYMTDMRCFGLHMFKDHRHIGGFLLPNDDIFEGNTTTPGLTDFRSSITRKECQPCVLYGKSQGCYTHNIIIDNAQGIILNTNRQLVYTQATDNVGYCC